ncbi:hypothetical protein F1D05_10575 [Kribbella qitaiheensis]|uniref:Uncharacterized protein n=1 Tax=Kribbella qitaiheensis TaxID=1544730 RepID=A0A7G6WW97_9ACTN|nr:hypothetical protein [Kribbella qitaiheensis]QNE18262.1 hypothetical protein F1D05_10575 [Kribbella qitaiheensis]
MSVSLRHRRPASTPLATHHQQNAAGDRRLLTSARGGDDASIAQIYDLHGLALLNLACAVSSDREAAESAVVEAVVQACTGYGNADPSGSLRHQLARLTYTHCVRPRGSSQASAAAGGGVQPQSGLGVAASRGFSVLSRHQRGVLALTVFGDHSYREAADLLDVTPATAGRAAEVRSARMPASDRRPAEHHELPARAPN